MATPTPRSLQQYIKDMVQTYVTKSKTTDLAKGSVNRSFIEAAALSDFRTQGEIMSALASADIDNSTGIDLDNIGFAAGVQRTQARESNGVITVSQKNFSKIATKVYQGTAAPPAGSVTVNIADATQMPSSGSVYFGRGTNNLEGPVPYSSITPLGSYYQLNLSSPTTKNHNIGETVILAQGGNRSIPAGVLVQTRSTLTSQSVTFRTLSSLVLLDGEVQISDVPVICTQIGSIGNISTNAIVEFATAPFPNATASNPLAFVSGRDVMNDIDYRELIKKTEQSRVKGTDLAIIQGAQGVQSTDDNKTVTSAEIRKPSNRGEPSTVFLDDSTGYQPIFTGQGFEQIIDNANGGDIYLQVQKEDIVKATVVSSLEAPFAIKGGQKLSVKIGGLLSEHIFSSSDFATEGSADTFEVVNSINNNSALTFSARGFSNSKRIVLFAKNFMLEDIQVSIPSSGIDANDFLGFSKNIVYSMRLYKNDVLLIKDGVTPTAYSTIQNTWNSSITSGATLKIKVDQTSFQNITIIDSDFVPYGFTTVNKNNSLDSWASVLTSKLAGITVTVEGNRLKMVTNKGANNSAYIEVSSSGLSNSLANGDNMWAAVAIQGAASDYSFNRATGQIQLVVPASPGDVFTAGSRFTRGFVDTGVFSSGSLTIGSTPPPKMWFIADALASRRAVSLSNITTVSITNPTANVWRYTFSVAGAISGIAKDDWVIVTDNTLLSANNEGFWRVNTVDGAGTWFEIIKTTGTVEGPINLVGANDIIFINSPLGEIQSITLPSGLQTLTAIANSLKQLQGITAEVIGGRKVRISTLSFDAIEGSIFLAAQNINAASLGLLIGASDKSEISHTAFNNSQTDFTFLEFFHDSVATGDSSIPYTSIVTSTNLDVSGYEPNNKVLFLNPYGTNTSSNRKINTDIDSLNGVNVSLRNSLKLNEIITNDRYALGVPYNFSALDNVVAILDNDTVNKTFNIRMGRKAKVYLSPNASVFRAYDSDFGPTANFPSGFGNGFDFKDFKIHMKARAKMDPSGANNIMMVRSAAFGPNGNKTRVGVFYPQAESSAITHAIQVSNTTDFKIFLASAALRTGGTWDSTTSFDVTNPAGNIWRYTYNGTGTAANFLSAAIVTGDIVNITSSSTFSSANTGTFALTAVTNTYFEITNYTPGVAETGRTLASAVSLKFYPLSAAANTAVLIGTYINANSQASEFITITQMESGAGVVSSSTEDDIAGVSKYLQLKDGENWVSVSNIGTTIAPLNEFTLKRSLNIFGADLLNEDFYIVPTRAEHLNRYLNRFAVTGISSLGQISLSHDAKSIQFYSDLFGSAGVVSITGGSGNLNTGAVVESAAIINNAYVKFSIPKAASIGFQSGQWIQFANTGKLAKDNKFKATTQLNWGSQQPAATQSTITVANSSAVNAYQNGYFWTKRAHDATTTSQMRIEKQGKFLALSWTGTGVAPLFKKTYVLNNVSRTSNISQVTANAAHGISIGTSIELTISGLTNSSFNGVFRAVADSTTTFIYRQDLLPDVVSAVDSGSALRQVKRTDRIKLSGAFDVRNQGEHIIAGVFGNNTIYFESTNYKEEDVILLAANDIQIYDYDSVRPGDTFSVGSTALDSITPFESHQGDFTVLALTANETDIIIQSPTNQNVLGVTLASSFNTVRVIEESAFTMYGKIYNISPSPSNSNNTDIVIEGLELPTKIAPSAGTSISSVSKLGFSADVKTGEDSYKYYGGLISAVGQKIRGKSLDPISYPGVAATGSFIEFDAALPKRIQLSIVIRNRTGTPFTVIKSRVQSAVNAYVNSIGVGKPVIFSEVVVAAQSIDGVQAVSISSPTYNSSNDQIVSQPNQKPLILSIDTDIIVSQAT